MIWNVYSNGFYINIGDWIVFVYVRLEEGVNKFGMVLLCLDELIELLDN